MSDVSLLRTTRITGPNVNFSATGNLTLGGAGTLIAEITAATHSPIKAAGTATLGGTLQVEFNGPSPVSGDSWDLVDASAINGNFGIVDIPGFSLGLGQQFSVNRVSDVSSTHGQVARLSLDQLLVLEVNRDTNVVSIKNPAAGGSVLLDSYTVRSDSSSLGFSSWSSFQDNASTLTPGWEEALNSNNSRLTEIKPVGSQTISGGTTISLGPIFDPQQTAFGVTGRDYVFQYAQEDSTNITGLVQYVGGQGAVNNTLVLQVDPQTGKAILFNDSTQFSGDIQGYDIASRSGSLLFTDGDWSSLDDQNAAGGDWRESNVSANRLAELKEADLTNFNPNAGTLFDFGELFDVNGDQDLELNFLQASQSTPTAGAVVYSIIGGDYNGDGLVNAADYTRWRNTFGASVTAGTAADGDRDGTIGQGDYDVWVANFGRDYSGLSSAGAVSSVPEPSGILMCLSSLRFDGECRPAKEFVRLGLCGPIGASGYRKFRVPLGWLGSNGVSPQRVTANVALPLVPRLLPGNTPPLRLLPHGLGKQAEPAGHCVPRREPGNERTRRKSLVLKGRYVMAWDASPKWGRGGHVSRVATTWHVIHAVATRLPYPKGNAVNELVLANRRSLLGDRASPRLRRIVGWPPNSGGSGYEARSRHGLNPYPLPPTLRLKEIPKVHCRLVLLLIVLTTCRGLWPRRNSSVPGIGAGHVQRKTDPIGKNYVSTRPIAGKYRSLVDGDDRRRKIQHAT